MVGGRADPPPRPALTTMTDDAALLSAFAARRDEAAFAALVERYGGLVVGAAMRRLRGDRALAEEVAQNVFATLARKAGELRAHPALAAWLQRAAAFESMRAAEKEQNRARVMESYRIDREALDKASPAGPPGDPRWGEALPALDEAMAALPELDREVLLRRYWRGQPYAEIAAALGRSSGALEKRAARALDKLARWFRGRRGLALPAAALATGLGAALQSGAEAAPAGLAAGALAAASSGGGAAAITTTTTTATIMKTKLLTGAGALAALLCATGVGWVAARASTSNARALEGLEADGDTSGPKPPREGPGGDRTAPEAGLAEGRRASLATLLRAAEAELRRSALDTAAKVRAGARISLIAPEDLPAAAALAVEIEGARRQPGALVALVLERWAGFDGAAACGFALEDLARPWMGMHPVSDPLRAWASRDPEAAFGWFMARKQTDPAMRYDQASMGRFMPISDLRWVVGAWAMRDPSAAAAALASLDDPQSRSGAVIGLREMAALSEGRIELLDAVGAMPGSEYEQRDRIRDLLDDWSRHDPAELAGWLDGAEFDKSEDYMMCKSVLVAWLGEDRDAAIDWWLAREGGHPGRDTKLTRLVDAWAQEDPVAASEWLAAQELGDDHAGAVLELAEKLVATDPESAVEWAKATPSDGLRPTALRTVLKNWARADAPAAWAAYDALPADLLDAEARGRIEAELPPREAAP